MDTASFTAPIRNDEFDPTGSGLRAAIGQKPPDDALPHNLDAEQALLGALLYDNEVYNRVGGFLKSEHFFDPVHGRIFEACASQIAHGRLASPALLKNLFAGRAELKAIGGEEYLAFLVAETPGAAAAEDFARDVFDLHLRRGLIRVGEETAFDARKFELEDDPRGQLESAERKLYALAEEGSIRKGFQSFQASLEVAIQTAAAAYERDGHMAGLATGLVDLDRKLGGMHPSDLIILAGRPSMGKTALATNIAYNVAKANRRERQPDGSWKSLEGGVVGFFSLEMSAEQLATRVLGDVTGVPSDKIRRGDITEDDYARLFDASKELSGMPLHIDDTGGLNIGALSARARRLKRQQGLDLIVVDYLQLVGAANRRSNDGRVQEVSEVTQGLKALAKDLDVPVIALSQLSRQVEQREDKRPQLSDLRESGSIEQDADVVMFVFREEYYVGRAKPSEDDEKFIDWQKKMDHVHGRAEVIIGKQRHGPIGTVDLHFDERLTRFANLARDQDYRR